MWKNAHCFLSPQQSTAFCWRRPHPAIDGNTGSAKCGGEGRPSARLTPPVCPPPLHADRPQAPSWCPRLCNQSSRGLFTVSIPVPFLPLPYLHKSRAQRPKPQVPGTLVSSIHPIPLEFIYLLILERGEGRETEREGNVDQLPPLPTCSNQGPNLQSRHVPRLGIEPVKLSLCKTTPGPLSHTSLGIHPIFNRAPSPADPACGPHSVCSPSACIKDLVAWH